MPDLSDRQREVLELLPTSQPGPTRDDIADELGVKATTAEYHMARLKKKGYDFDYDRDGNVCRWVVSATPGSSPTAEHDDTHDDMDSDDDDSTDADTDSDTADDSDSDSDTAALPDLSDTPVADDVDPDSGDLTGRERVIVDELKTGATVDELTDRVNDRESVVLQHLKDLRESGWKVYIDDTAGHVALEGDQTLRSSEHTGTRTRKANRWWDRTHSALVKQYKAIDPPTASPTATPGNEDWVCHMTDLHAGDEVRGYDGKVIHDTDRLIPLIDHITQRSLSLSETHGREYDEAVLAWGGDMVTNEGIYDGQHENLDEWLDEQTDDMHDPLLRQIKAHAKRFDTVHVACQAGNHGEIRASGSSKQANADLILYKGIRNTVAALQEVGHLENVRFTIGRAEGPTPFYMRDGAIHAQLRHGQDRSPQADTSARKKEWLSTILDSENFGSKFDVSWMGHHHVSGRLPWNGPTVLITGSPKPGGEYPRALGELVGPNQPTIATCHGVSNDGVTGVFPVDTRNYARE